MRCLLTIIFIFGIAGISFAMKPVCSQPAFHPAKTKYAAALQQLLNKTPSEDHSALNKDDAEHPTLIRQVVKKHVISSIQLFNRPVTSLSENDIAIHYPITTLVNTGFMDQLLYPNHFFW